MKNDYVLLGAEAAYNFIYKRTRDKKAAAETYNIYLLSRTKSKYTDLPSEIVEFENGNTESLSKIRVRKPNFIDNPYGYARKRWNKRMLERV